MMGRMVTIVPKFGDQIRGMFVAEIRVHELTRSKIFCIEVAPGIHAFIDRENVSYVIISEAGLVTATEMTRKKKNVQEMFKEGK
jgi:hypothetical protein